MENVTKKIVLPTKGICNLTPDQVCGDDELADCVGLTFNDDAIRPLQDNKKLDVSIEGQLLRVHDLGTQKNYIYYGMSTIEPFSVSGSVSQSGSSAESGGSSSGSSSSGSSTDTGIYTLEKKAVVYIYYWCSSDNVLHVKLSESIYYDISISATFGYKDSKLGYTRYSDYFTIKAGDTEATKSVNVQMEQVQLYVNSYTGDDVTKFQAVKGEPPSSSKPISGSGSSISGEDASDKYNALFFHVSGVDSTNLAHIGSFSSSVLGVEAVGNTLIVNTSDGIKYFMWDSTSCAYTYYGELPVPYIEFRNTDRKEIKEELESPDVWVKHTDDTFGDYYTVNTTKQADYNNLVTGLYAECKNTAHSQKRFYAPYFVRAAFELYDGELYHITNPILMLPNFNSCASTVLVNGSSVTRMYLDAYKMQYRLNNTNLAVWKDIIKKVVILVSAEVDESKTSEDAVFTDGNTLDAETPQRGENGIVDNAFYDIGTNLKYAFKLKTEQEMAEELKAVSNFYWLCELPLTCTNGYFKDLDPYFKSSTLENITTQQSIDHDDYYSFCGLVAEGMSTLNRRLNVYGVKRGFFDGFQLFLPYYSSNLATYRIYVYIKSTGLSERVIMKEFSTYEIIDHYFYYPDPRAYKADIYMKSGDNWVLRKTIELEEHSGLNGAIYLDGYPKSTDSNSTASYSASSTMPTTNYTPEYLHNYLMQSDVDNPFVFFSSSYVRVGQGSIIGLAALTTALNQDAFKVATTIAFTTQGIWALEIDSEGVYKTVPPPFSREVCCNSESITMVDNGIYFVSTKGLMYINDNNISCVSNQLRGKSDDLVDLRRFLYNPSDGYGCEIAFDYNSRLLLLSNKRFDYHYIVNLSTNTFSRLENGLTYISIATDYPDTLVQDMKYNVYSMLDKPDINEDENTYEGSMVTRPLKFGASLNMKSIREMLHIMDISGSLSVVYEVSNDCTTWITIPSLIGRGWKFFRLRYTFKDLKAYDTFAGTALSYTISEQDKMR